MIIGAKKLLADLDGLSQVDIQEAMETSIQHVRSEAVSRVRTDTGELKGSIYAETKMSGNKARGTCWTNKPYAAYVEFGTGKKGQENHAGISPEVSPMYSMRPWWIHEGNGPNEVDRATAEKYGWFYIDTPEGRFYQCTGQAAHPFMYPALQDSTEFIEKIFTEKINEAMK